VTKQPDADEGIIEGWSKMLKLDFEQVKEWVED
jgi:hypothetical protein